MKNIFLSICLLFAFQAHADLGRLKRYILRDCEKAEAAFKETTISDRPEILRYLAEVFRLNLGELFDAPLAPGNLADPADMWRSLSGESDVESKSCALRLARIIGPEALSSLALAIPLLPKTTVPPQLKRDIVATLLELWSKTPPQLYANDNHELRRALRLLASSIEDNDTRRIATGILVFALDSAVLPMPVQSLTGAALSGGDPTTVQTVPTPIQLISVGKDKRALLKFLGSANEQERRSALSQLTTQDLKALEGFRVTAARTEKMAASLAIARLGGKWTLDPQATKNLDCGFAASFLPFAIPTLQKQRQDLERLVFRCLINGKTSFIAQLISTPELLQSPTMVPLLAIPLMEISGGSENSLTAQKIAIVVRRLVPDLLEIEKLTDVISAISIEPTNSTDHSSSSKSGNAK